MEISAFAQGVVEQLSGDSNLIAVRSRASRERPFTVVKKIQADAEANYRSKIKELETSLNETQRKVNELQKGKQTGEKFILSAEQQQELANFQKKEAEVKSQLKTVRKQVRAEIDSLETRVKWLNIAAMPAIVAYPDWAWLSSSAVGEVRHEADAACNPWSPPRRARGRGLASGKTQHDFMAK